MLLNHGQAILLEVLLHGQRSGRLKCQTPDLGLAQLCDLFERHAEGICAKLGSIWRAQYAPGSCYVEKCRQSVRLVFEEVLHAKRQKGGVVLLDLGEPWGAMGGGASALTDDPAPVPRL